MGNKVPISVWIVFFGLLGLIVYAAKVIEPVEFLESNKNSQKNDKNYIDNIGELKDFSIRKDNSNSQVEWKLTSKSGKLLEKNIYKINEPYLNQYVGLDERVITSDEGIWNANEQLLSLTGNVQVSMFESNAKDMNRLKSVLKTDSAVYSMTENIVSSKGAVHFKREALDIKGENIVSNIKSGRTVLKKNVTVLIGQDFMKRNKDNDND